MMTGMTLIIQNVMVIGDMKIKNKTTMSKIAEQKALEAYPIDIIPDDDTMGFTSSDRNDVIRLGYIKGYDQAMQDFLEKYEEFFKSMYETMGKPNLGDKTIELFKNYIENE